MSKEAHRVAFQSRHTRPGHHVWPIHDIWLNQILQYVLPTHKTTHRLKILLLAEVLLALLYVFRNVTYVLPVGLLLVTAGIVYIYCNWRFYDFTRRVWMDPTIPAVGRLPMHVPLGYYSSVQEARQAACQPLYKSKNILRLDGDDWKFCLYPTVQQALQSLERRPKQTIPMMVPSNWTLNPRVDDNPIYTNQKYPWPCTPPCIPHENPTGVYRKEFQADPNKDYTIVLNGFESAAWVYLNGKFVGFSKDSRLPAEFIIRPAVHNALVIVVARWSDGSYVEDQDDWWMAGLHRSVDVCQRPAVRILDYLVQADANGHLQVKVRTFGANGNLTLQLYNDEQVSVLGKDWKKGTCLMELHETTTTNLVTTFSADLDPSLLQTWTAETPHLYTLVLSLTKGKSTHCESCRVGFRTLDIANGAVHVNGRPITVAGINRHEHDPDHGKVARWERMVQDICLLKQNNFNTVRTSHYPCHSLFYRLCDFYGLYVWDEANIETHGFKPMGRLAQDWGWEATFVTRITRTVSRDRNHACIIFWSMGNEAGRGRNFEKARKRIREMDPSRPIMYEGGGCVAEGTGRTELTDVVCTMYPVMDRTIWLATREDEDRPVILCEYSHAMGNSNGNLHYYWNAIWDDTIPRLRGGCIWDMIDQGIRLPDKKSGGHYFGYGGDFGDKINDLQFCINGMFTPDRKSHPAIYEIKYLQQPVSFSVPSNGKKDEELILTIRDKRAGSVVLRVTNRYTFLDLSHIEWSWELVSNSSPEALKCGKFELPPRATDNMGIVLILDSAVQDICKLYKSSAFNAFFLNVRGNLAKKQTWVDDKHEIVRFQFPLTIECDETPAEMHLIAPSSQELQCKESSEALIVTNGEATILQIDKSTGGLQLYAPNGVNLLEGSCRPNFTRAATDNDKGGLELTLNFMFPFSVDSIVSSLWGTDEFSYYSHWKNAGLTESKAPQVKCVKIDHTTTCDSLAISAVCDVSTSDAKKPLFKVELSYTVFDDGRVCISHLISPSKRLRRVPTIPRVGMYLPLSSALNQIQYFGRGPWENYPDRKAGAEMGVYDTTPAFMPYLDYVVPTENGSRSDCQWSSFRTKDTGDGVLVSVKSSTKSSFSFGASYYTNCELDEALHTCDLPKRENGTVHVNLDYELMGLGGDNSWFPVVYPEFHVKPTQPWKFDVWLIPLKKDENPLDAAMRARM